MATDTTITTGEAKPNGAAPRPATGPTQLQPVQYGFDRDNFRTQAKEIWARIPKDGGLPGVDSLKSLLLPKFRGHGVLVSLSGDGSDARIGYLGLSIAEIARVANRSELEMLSDAPDGSILAELPRFNAHVGRSMNPIEFSNLKATGPKGEARFDGVLLPFGDDSDNMLHIFAVIDLAKNSREDENVLDLTSEYFEDDPVDTLELEFDQLLVESEVEMAPKQVPPPLGETPLASALDEARTFADYAKAFERRSHRALYAAISKAYDFALLAYASPDEFVDLIERAGITMQERAPMTPIVKLVFGADFDRTRVTEYATVLAHGVYRDVPMGGMSDFLQEAEGGIKGIVAEARLLRRGDGPSDPVRREVRKATAKKLRKLSTSPLERVRLEGGEFGLVMVRQLEDGSVVMVGEVSDDAAMIEKLGKQMLASS